MGGIFCGALTANRIAGRMAFSRQIGIGFGLLMSATLVNLAYHFRCPPVLPWSVLPLFVYTFGMSMVAPGATLLALDLFPHIRGGGSILSIICNNFDGGGGGRGGGAAAITVGPLASRRTDGI